MTIDIQEYNETIEANKRSEYQRGFEEGVKNKRAAEYQRGYDDGVKDVFMTIRRTFSENLDDIFKKFGK